MLGTSALEKDSLFVTNNDMSFFFLFITQHLSGNSGSQILKSYSIEIAVKTNGIKIFGNRQAGTGPRFTSQAHSEVLLFLVDASSCQHVLGPEGK